MHKNWPGINPMGLGAPWEDAYPENQQKEQSSVIFINQLPKSYKKMIRN